MSESKLVVFFTIWLLNALVSGVTPTSRHSKTAELWLQHVCSAATSAMRSSRRKERSLIEVGGRRTRRNFGKNTRLKRVKRDREGLEKRKTERQMEGGEEED
mmetsp:Transcript_26289/g.59691  ORF Transcript_26289/g.59691 Transcript_26289/m.59691 type:complete len:102 (-) Transcript_26289:91-396(-)